MHQFTLNELYLHFFASVRPQNFPLYLQFQKGKNCLFVSDSFDILQQIGIFLIQHFSMFFQFFFKIIQNL